MTDMTVETITEMTMTIVDINQIHRNLQIQQELVEAVEMVDSFHLYLLCSVGLPYEIEKNPVDVVPSHHPIHTFIRLDLK